MRVMNELKCLNDVLVKNMIYIYDIEAGYVRWYALKRMLNKVKYFELIEFVDKNEKHKSKNNTYVKLQDRENQLI
jgi:hypothetical protein